MNTLETIYKRKSVREYKDKSIDKETIEKIVKTGFHAPIAGEVKSIVITNKDLLKIINDEALNVMQNSDDEFMKARSSLEGYQPLYGAPVLVLILANEGPYAQLNAGCASENIILTAESLGLATCFVVSPLLSLRTDKRDEILSKIEVPEGFNIINGIIIGEKAGDKFSVEREIIEDIKYIE